MKSMTGYAKHSCVVNGNIITIEIRTLNSKQIDVNLRAPSTFREKEIEIRNIINQLERGKIDITISEETNNKKTNQLDIELVKNRFEELRSVNQSLDSPCSDRDLLTTILNQSEVWATKSEEEMMEENWQTILCEITEATKTVDQFRKHEGEVLKSDFVKHINYIEEQLNEVPQFEEERIETAKERIRRFMNESGIKEVDENRFEQELIYYLEKLDITEEKTRLKKHIEYFRATMDNEEGCGKKMGFVAQEMGREINTMGSKANHIEIQRRVILMKDALEKIKEQIGNIL